MTIPSRFEYISIIIMIVNVSMMNQSEYRASGRSQQEIDSALLVVTLCVRFVIELNE